MKSHIIIPTLFFSIILNVLSAQNNTLSSIRDSLFKSKSGYTTSVSKLKKAAAADSIGQSGKTTGRFTRKPQYKESIDDAIDSLIGGQSLLKSTAAGSSLEKQNENADDIGFKHYSYQQYYDGIPVESAQIKFHERADSIYYVNGIYFDDLSIDCTPSITKKKALQQACEFAEDSSGEVAVSDTGSLVIAAQDGIQKQDYLCLAYKFRIGKWYVYVNAHTGELVNKISVRRDSGEKGTAYTLYHGIREITTSVDNGEYYLYDEDRNIYTYNGTNDEAWEDDNPPETPVFFTDDDNTWKDLLILQYLTIDELTDDWNSSVVDESPDLYLVISNQDDEVVYESDIEMNTSLPVDFTVINLPLTDEGYTFAVMDYNRSRDDVECASFELSLDPGSHEFTDSATSGSYYLYGDTTNFATDVHWGLSQTYDYYLNVHNRKSFDGAGDTITCHINPNLMSDWDDANAFATHYTENGRVYDYICFGLGDDYYLNPVVSLDIAAHEFTHEVTAYTADLIYQGESGAINESISDIFGTCVEFYTLGDSANWTIGEGAMKIADIMRSLSNPKSDDLLVEYEYNGETYELDMRQPDTYEGEYWSDPTDYSDDYGGVHQNNSVMNYWFYLLSEGGSGTNDNDNEYSVTGITIAGAEQIVYRALALYFTEWSEFADVYTSTLQAAEDIFGADSDQWWAVKNAWYAVGVSDSDPDSYCSGTVTVTDASGTISDGSGGSDYDSNSSCKWLIAPPGATSITFDFTEFDTEYRNDYVIMYSSISDNSDYAVFAWYGDEVPEEFTINGGAVLVQFISDDSEESDGWSFDYTSEQVDHCEGTTILTDTSGTVSDNSSDSEDYGNNLECTWSIAPPGVDSITIDFDYFATEQDYDGLLIFDGEPDLVSLSNLVVSLTGNIDPGSYTIYSDEMWLYFTSDAFVADVGFSAHYTAYTTPYCDGVEVLTDDAGTINDGSDTAVYYHNSECGWLIQPEDAVSITLSFEDFNLEASEGDGKTYYDYVEVFDGADESATSLGKFAGSVIPSSVTSTGGEMFVKFYSNTDLEYDGFTASYITETETYCDEQSVYTDSIGAVSDGSGDKLYGNNTDCAYLIQAEEGDSIILNFSSFDIDESDVLIIYDGSDTSATILAQLSGSDIPDLIVSSGNAVYIVFLTDDSDRGEGWSLDYSSTGSFLQTVNLEEGWNMVSFYVVPDDKSLASVFSNVSDAVDVVKNDSGYFIPTQSTDLNSIDSIDYSSGYLIYANEATSFGLYGSFIDSSEVDLTKEPGMHLTGFPYHRTSDFDSFFSTDDVSLIKNFEGFYDSDDAFSTLENLTPGEAYYINYK